MNNEEKILSMLETLVTKVDNIEQDVKSIKAQQKIDAGSIDLIAAHILTIDQKADLTNKKLDSLEFKTQVNTYDISELKIAK